MLDLSSYNGDYEENGLLGYNVMWFRESSMFWKNISTPYSSETSGLLQNTCHYNSEDCTLNKLIFSILMKF
jgi:hypothetical protein